MRILIPTYGRPHKQITADQLSAAGIEYSLVLSKNDKYLDSYLERANLTGKGGRSLVAPVKTISQKRQWILDYVRDPKIIMMDDDLRFYARQGDKKFTIATPRELRIMVKWFDFILESYAHAGIVDKFMSNTTPRGYVESRRYNSVLGYNRELWPRPRPHFRIPVSEEHDVHLQLATKGLPPIISTEFSKGTSYYNAGGCTDERTGKSERAGHLKFAKLWPELVKAVPHAKNISGLAIKVRWKKAAQIGASHGR